MRELPNLATRSRLDHLLPVFILLALALVLDARCVAAAGQSSGISPNDFVQLERTECYGSCPVYTVRIYADGRVQWHGERWVQVTGDSSAQVPPSDARALIEAFLDPNVWSLYSQYKSGWTDMATHITTVQAGSRQKRISDYGASSPLWFRDLERRIDDLADTHRWRHGDPRAERFEPFGLRLAEDAREPKPGVTPLMRAAASKKGITEVRKWISEGVGVNSQDASGWTALMYAAKLGTTEIIQALLADGANVRLRSHAGQTALMASGWGDADVDDRIRALLAAGEDINAQDADGHTPLMLAVQAFEFPRPIKLLLSSGANLNLSDKAGDTALDIIHRKRCRGDISITSSCQSSLDRVTQLLSPSMK